MGDIWGVIGGFLGAFRGFYMVYGNFEGFRRLFRA